MFDFLYELYWRYYCSLSSLSGLELLPDELLVKILSYESVSDLFYGWLNLNWRFNAIVHSIRIKEFYTVPKQWHSCKNSNSIVESLRYFASQVVFLHVDESIPLDVVKEINIVNCSHLRILKLCETTASQLDVIQAYNFPYLEHLSLVQATISFEVLCQFKSLRSCELNSLEIDAKHSHLSSSIQSLALRWCHPWDMAILLRHFPQMIFFKVFIFLSNSSVHHPIVNCVHPNMISLDIHFFDLDSSMNEVDNSKYGYISELLASISTVKRIRYCVTLVDMVNFNYEQFQCAVLKLNFVRFSCRLMWLHRFQPVPNIDCIRQIPLFNKLKLEHIGSKATLFRSIWTDTSILSYYNQNILI
ncbi:unnamed protein product [Adineta steineri]|uniref:F-box domain-containing protein n=1 Tax=Adineta steineri TaxID=433720 RepID=A0A819HU55_9BILA|nr:unnamed protein product [Adineta steineri]CAF3901563.1 unnamed protein product [Adineta steineri]